MMPITLIISIPLIAAFIILFLRNDKSVKYISFISSLIVFIISVIMFINFDSSKGFNFTEKYMWIKALNIHYYVGADTLSLLMILLTNFIMPISILSSYNYIKKDIKKYYIWLLILQSAIIGVFVSLDTFLFYIFWEAMLVPMYFLIGMWGGENRIYATIKFFIYTMAASLLMLAGIIFTYINLKNSGINSFEIFDFYKNTLIGKTQIFVFISFLIAFAVKIPLFPLHTWLPDAHVEAPTAVSVILAGVLLKMGVYGYIRFLIPMFPTLSHQIAPYISAVGVFGVIYASLMAWVQKDIKKLVAYSSVAHMGLIVLGVFSFNPEALSGAILQMINHGISTGGLFLMIGILYERTHTRLMENYGGIFKTVPFIATFFMIVTLSSIAVPSTNGFVGEILIFLGSFKSHRILTILAISGVILGAVYMLMAYEKIFFGKIEKDENKKILDLTIREWLYLIPVVIMIFWIGVFPNIFLSKIQVFVSSFLK
jgi:NADH-quinone oxidoreductase subunit M